MEFCKTTLFESSSFRWQLSNFDNLDTLRKVFISWGGILVWAYPSVRPLRFAFDQERLEIGSWNLIHGMCMKNKRTHIFFLFRRTCHCRVMFLFQLLDYKPMRPCEPKYLENRLSYDCGIWHIDCVQGVHDLMNVWQNFVNIWLNYLPFPTLVFCIVTQPCEQNIWITPWARIMLSDIQFEYMM